MLTRLWIARNNNDVSTAAWRKYSRNAKAWFSLMTLAFEVVDDRPPYEAQWVNPPPDEWDVPIWTAALRGHASFIVTENLKDGPPPDERGLRVFRSVWFVHPNEFFAFMRLFSETMATRGLPTLQEDTELTRMAAAEAAPETAEDEAEGIPAPLRRTIEEILKKAEEKGPQTAGE